MASLFLYDEERMKPGDPSNLTGKGVPRAIEEHYQQALKEASWFAYNSTWKAAAYGVSKGILIAGAISMLGAGVINMFAEHAAQGALLDSFAKAGINGMEILAGSGTTIGAIVTVGATAGAIYEVSNQRDAVQKDLIKTRQMMRDLQNNIKDHDLGIQRAHDLEQVTEMDMQADSAINHPSWAERIRRQQSQVQGLDGPGGIA